jgi:hypothetical protein
MSAIEFWGNEKPKCPHCRTDYDVWDGDSPLGLAYQDEGRTTFDCQSCGKEFVCVTSVRYVFHTAVSEDAASDEEWGPQEAPEPCDLV